MNVGFWAIIKDDLAVLAAAPRSLGFYAAAALGLNRFSAVFLHRVSAHFRERRGFFRKLSSVAHRWNTIVNGCEIDPAAVIGPGLHLPHPHGVVFGPIRAGRNLTAQQNVTVGLRDSLQDFNDSAYFPILGDQIFIGAGASILGPIKVGDNARIGSNAVVVKDLASGATALGPAAEHRDCARNQLCA